MAPNRRRSNDNNDEDDDDETCPKPGMAEAFRQLDALDSLLATPVPPPMPKKALPKIDPPAVQAPPMEQQVQLYSEMVQELEEKDETGLYTDVLQDLGGSLSTSNTATKPSAPSTTTTTVTTTPTIATASWLDDWGTTPPTESSSSNPSTDRFMEQALREAIKEVQLNNPQVSKSILNDQEIMAEIEAIFDAGNEKLMESLEEIRQEQVSTSTGHRCID
jgi:hypothetical protein